MLDIKYSSRIEIKDGGTLPFLLVTTEDGKNYQIKIPNLYSSAMLKEYIAFNIATKIDINTPEATFIYLHEKQISNTLNNFKQYLPSYEAKFYSSLEMLKNIDGDIILFGIEWIEETVVSSELFFNKYFDNCISNNLFSIFSFDLLLYNCDRHKGNILIATRDKDKYEIYLIDHDRIFNSYSAIEDLQDIKDEFNSLYSQNTKYLFNYIDSKNKQKKILEIATKYKKIQKKEISNFLDIYSNTCPVDELNDKRIQKDIENFILHRIDNIENACKKNFKEGMCYA